MGQLPFTSNTYFWDFGFDITAVQGPNNQSFLQNGFAALGTPIGNVPSSPAYLVQNNTVTFNLFDVTNGATASGYKPISAKITFSNAQANQEASNPFGAGSITLADQSVITPQTSDGSTVFQIGQSPLAAAAFTNSSVIFGLNTQFKGWTILPALPIVAATGRFLFTITVCVQNSDGVQRTFVVDPEMIFGGSN